jgi:hypothetical protein
VANIGSNVDAAHLMAATPTVAVIPGAADEISTNIAHLFSRHARDYQTLAGKAAAFHEQLVQHLTASAVTYGSAEASNVALLQPFSVAAVPVVAAATAAQNALIGSNPLLTYVNIVGAVISALPGFLSNSNVLDALFYLLIAPVAVPLLALALLPLVYLS